MRFIVIPLVGALVPLVVVLINVFGPDRSSAPSTSAAQTSAAAPTRLTPTPSTVASSSVTSGTAASPDAAHPVWHHSTLTLQAGMNADLKSRSADFDRARSMAWPPGDVAYDKSSDGAPGYTLYLENSPRTTAALGTGGNWDRDTCVKATYGATTSGDIIAAGHGLCFNPDGDWYILIKVVSQDPTQITLDVTSWNQ